MLASEIRDTAEARFGDTTNAVYTEAEWLEYINEAYMDVVTAHPDWPFLESRNTSVSVTSSGETTLPTDVWRVTAVYNATDKLPLAQVHGRADFRRYFPDPASGLGIPLFYRLRANTLEVYPWPSVTTEIDLDVIVPPAVLTAAAEPVLPEQHQRILVIGALSKAYLDDGNGAMADAYQARFDRGIQRLHEDLLSPRGESYPGITDLGV